MQHMDPTLVALIDRCYEFVLTENPPDDLLTDTAHSLGFEVGSVISTARRAGTSRSSNFPSRKAGFARFIIFI